MRGRPPKAPELKVLEGKRDFTYRPPPRTIPRSNPGKPPRCLTEPQRKLWAEICEWEPRFRPGDRLLLERLCVATIEAREMTAMIRETGPLVRGRDGGTARNPLLMARGRLLEEAHRVSVELGLSPVSRLRLNEKVDDEHSEMDREYLHLIGVL